MIVLAIDTSSEQGSLVVLEDGGRMTEAPLRSPGGHSENLFGEIPALLRRAGVRLEDVGCFAAAAGPGSFTGVRVALAAAKGLAVALGKPMAAVSNLQALAWFGEAPLRAAVIDARRGDTYTALYDSSLAEVRPEMMTALEPWLASLEEGIELITSQPEQVPGRPVRVVPPEQLARAVAHLAQRGKAVDPALTDANYVRRADAQGKWVDRQ